MVTAYAPQHTREQSQARVSAAVTRLTAFWDRRTRALETFSKLRSLDPAASMRRDGMRPADSKLEPQITAYPRQYFDWAAATIANPPVIWFSPPQATGNDDVRAGKLENLAYGIDWHLGLNHRKTGSETWRFPLAEQALSGWIAFRPCVQKQTDGSVVFRLEFYDPATVFQEWDYYGLSVLVRKYETTLQDANAYLALTGGGRVAGSGSDMAACTEYWERTKDGVFHSFAVSQGDALAASIPLERQECTEIPIITRPAGGRGRGKDVADWGRSILDPILEPCRAFNQTMTLLREKARRSVFGDALLSYSNTGQPVVEAKDFGGSKTPIVPLNPTQGEDAKYLNTPPLTGEMRVLVETQWADIERGGVPAALFGINAPAAASGYLDKNLALRAELRLGRYAGAWSSAAEDMMKFFVGEIRRQKITVELQSRNLREMGMEGVALTKFGPGDIPETYVLLAGHEILSPVDKQAISSRVLGEAAQGARTMRSAMHEIGIQDPQKELLEIKGEQALAIIGGPFEAAGVADEQADQYEKAGDTQRAAWYRKGAEAMRAFAAQQMLEITAGLAARQPNAKPQTPAPGQLPTPIRTGGAPPPYSGVPGPLSARPGNTNAQANGVTAQGN